MTDRHPLHASHHCRHYSYVLPITDPNSGPKCAAGILLDEPGSTACCMPEPKTSCPSRVDYTDAEREVWEREKAACMERLGKAVGAVPHPIPMRTGGTVQCPNCGGTLHYGRWRGGGEVVCETRFCASAHFQIRGDTPWPASPKPEKTNG